MSANFSSSGISIGRQTEVDTSGTKKDSAGLGERFRQRHESTEGLFDFFGENSPGFTPLKIPWNIALSLNYQLSQPTVNQKTESININATFSLKLTQSWSIDGSTQYDFTRRELMAPTFNIRKDMHCWELVFTWYPMGLNAGYYLKFGIKAANLKDLMIEKRSNPIF
jgi:hypothetical protein